MAVAVQSQGKAHYSVLGPLNKGCKKQLKNCFRWLQFDITRSPITDSDGNISLFQLLWKGTTDLLRQLLDKTFC